MEVLEKTEINELQLTEDQKTALNAFNQFLVDPKERVFVIQGYSGCGKTTLVKHILDNLDKQEQLMKMLDPEYEPYPVALTATTNKAAESLYRATKWPCTTIHSFLGLRVSTDYKTQQSRLVRNKRADDIERSLVFIDEASYIDSDLLSYIFRLMPDSKIVFIGDPAQLTPVKHNNTPVFNASFTTTHLKEVVRQAKDNPIIDLSTKFRQTVETGEFFSFTPDGHHIAHLDRETFDKELIKEFTRSDWHFHDSKILAWTNKTVVNYNKAIQNLLKGVTEFQNGDYAIVNSYIYESGFSLKTDQMVHIIHVGRPFTYAGITGRDYTIEGGKVFFMPDSRDEWEALRKKAVKEEQYDLLQRMETWIDLRAAYACTVNKAQGSTFDKVFIDLDDISRCNSGDQIARMLYVAVSRARNQVFLTGDLA